MQILSGIQFATHFVDTVVVETKRFVSSTVNVILMRQTCGQRSSMSAGDKRQGLAFYFSLRIWYIIWESKCRRESDLGLCTTSILAKRMRLRSADFRLKDVPQDSSEFANARWKNSQKFLRKYISISCLCMRFVTSVGMAGKASRRDREARFS